MVNIMILSFFLADGRVRGIASRVSVHEIVNVAKGGRGQAVVLCLDKVESIGEI